MRTKEEGAEIFERAQHEVDGAQSILGSLENDPILGLLIQPPPLEIEVDTEQ